MSQLALTNVISISVSQGNPGIGNYNTSNVALFTSDAPAGSVETLTLSGIAASGTFVLNFGALATAAINWNDTVDTIQAKVNAVTGFSQVVVSGSIASKSLVLAQPGYLGALPLVTITANSLQTVAPAAITISAVLTSAGWSGGSLGYGVYLTPTQVGLDFGTGSKTYAMANAIFSQQPNILIGGGQLVVILMQVSQQSLAFSGIAASGTFEVSYGGNNSAAINWNDEPAAIQAKVQAVPGLSQALVVGSIASQTLTIIMRGVYGVAGAITTTANSLQTSVPAAITITPTINSAGETLAAAITRTVGLVQYFGILINESVGTSQNVPAADVSAAAAVVLPLVKMLFLVTNSSTDLTATTGLVAVNTSAGNSNTRINYYGDSVVVNALVFIASYVGRGLSVDFSGSNTTITLHLKQLLGVTPDPSMTETLLNLAVLVGADTYVSLQGVSAIFCSGANLFFDQVYNRLWLTGALQVAGFNYLAQSNSKIPQTEQGMDGLKGAYRAILEQAVTNEYCAPGAWNSSTTFGNQNDLIANVAQRGYYIFSVPVAQQSQANRAARQAPLVQIALKEAGAIHSSTVIVSINP